MIPPLIIQQARNNGINVIAITDHNSTGNINAVQKAAVGSGVTVLPGMELQTREEVHLLCIFDTLDQAEEWQALIDAAMPDMKNRPDIFGEQFIVDETGEFIRREEKLLNAAVNIGLHDAWRGVEDLGGICIPAHVNRQAFGLIGVLGFIPDDIPFEAMEISASLTPSAACKFFPQLRNYPLIQDGDVHVLDDFWGTTELVIDSPTVAEIRLAFRGQENRSAVIRENKSQKFSEYRQLAV